MGKYQKPRGFLRSLNEAWRGLVYTWKTQKHLQFHIFAGTVVFALAWYVDFSRFEWLILILSVSSVIAAEVINTAVECVVDLAEPNFHPLAGMAKDIAAGVVLVTSIQAVVVGIILFSPVIWRWIH